MPEANFFSRPATAGVYRTDVLVIGGGVTGTGIARDLALRGVSCLVVDSRNIAAGASGSNHGLLHSGARYVQTDAQAAAECREEGDILKKTVPHCIEDTGGLFVALEGDDTGYADAFPALCAASGIAARMLDVKDALLMEPVLSPRLVRAFHVPDASIDPFRLCLDLMAHAADSAGSVFLSATQIVGFDIAGGRIRAAFASHPVSGEFRIEAKEYVNATGAWSATIAALAGVSLPMLFFKGTMLVTHERLAKRVINRLRLPGDGDILAPGGTVSVLGTTSVRLDFPDAAAPSIAEVDLNIREGATMVPALANTRFIRTYAGVRPLVGKGENGRAVSRNFLLADHALGVNGGVVENLVSITGGKLTTFRLMAEKTCDLVCAKLGVTQPCRTRMDILPASKGAAWTEPGRAARVWFERRDTLDPIFCECEMVPQSAVQAILDTLPDGEIPGLDALGLRSRIGKGPCQGAFCSARITAYLYDRGFFAGKQGLDRLTAFLKARFKGQRPVLWGTQMIQAELAEAVHCGTLCLDRLDWPGPVPETDGVPPRRSEPSFLRKNKPDPTGSVADVAIIGAGMAGLAACIYAVNRGLSVMRTGGAGALAHATGYLDVLDMPQYTTLAAFSETRPDHPYYLLHMEEVHEAVAEYIDFMATAGHPYVTEGRNMRALSPAGTVKGTYAVPRTMYGGVEALRHRTPCLLADFRGLKSFSARVIAAVLHDEWPDITPVTLDFPDLNWADELYPEAMARVLESADAREALAAVIRPHLGTARCLGLPAVLGIQGCHMAQEHLEALLGIPVFEIPTMFSGISAIRIREHADAALRDLGARLYSQQQVRFIRKMNDGFHITATGIEGETVTVARALILATGRFLGGGLEADRELGVREPLLGLPLSAPASREDWHAREAFASAGHPVNRAGIRVDADFRPVDADGRVVAPDLYAAGSILAGQDWVREKSGSGIALSSAWKAISALSQRCREGQ